MEFFAFIIFILAVIFNVVLTLFVYFRNPRSATNRIFGLLGLSISIWVTIMYFSLRPFSLELSLFLIRLSIFTAIPMSMLFFLMVHTLPSKTLLIKKWELFFLIFASAIVMIICISPYAFTTVKITNNIPSPEPGIGLILFGIYTIGINALTIYVLYTKYHRADSLERRQLPFITLGIVLMHGLLISTVFIPTAVFQYNKFVYFSPLYTLIFLFLTSYAIVKHRFLDIHLVVARAVSYSLLIASFTIYYALLFSLIASFFSGSPIESKDIFVSTVLALIMALSFPELRHIIEKVTDKVFYKNKYDTSTLLHSLAKIMAGTYNLEKLSHELLRELTQEMKLKNGSIFLIKDNKIIHNIHEGYKTDPHFDVDKLLKLHYAGKSFMFEDLQPGEYKEILREMNFSFVANLKNADKTVGMVCLGFKLSGDTFTPDDINVLETFTSEASVAIQNALAFDQIQKFNSTLQEEVNKATKDFKNVNEEVYKKNIELKRVTDELELANEKLKQLDHLKDEFVSLASHELRTPMTAIKSYLWLFLQYNKTQLDPKERIYIERAYEATDRLINLVNDMLNVSRIESGRMTIAMRKVDMVHLAKEVMDELEPTAQKFRVSIELKTEGDNLPPVAADQNKIREVLINLVGNSLKFTDMGGKVTIRLYKEGDMFVTEVTDTGKGIKPEDLPKLFQKFGIIGTNYLQKQNTQGTGLGLYISKSIVNLHGGKIWMHSDGENKGATFSFTLKQFQEGDEDKIIEAQITPPSNGSDNQGKPAEEVPAQQPASVSN